MKRQNNREVGSRYEKRAAAFLERQGLTIVELNYRCRAGEIDIVARDGETYVFCEVKYRRTLASGDPAEAVDWRKQRKIYLAASWYLREKRLALDTPCRFDVVALWGEEGEEGEEKTKIRWIPNAFGMG